MIGVIYWTACGSTEEMAKAVAEGIREAGKEVSLLNVANVSVEDALAMDALALGCPAMGDEVLEEGEFEPFFTALESNLSGKPVVLFGSYGWGTGVWMEEWVSRTQKTGAKLVAHVIACGAPDADAVSALTQAGKDLANA